MPHALRAAEFLDALPGRRFHQIGAYEELAGSVLEANDSETGDAAPFDDVVDIVVADREDGPAALLDEVFEEGSAKGPSHRARGAARPIGRADARQGADGAGKWRSRIRTPRCRMAFLRISGA